MGKVSLSQAPVGGVLDKVEVDTKELSKQTVRTACPPRRVPCPTRGIFLFMPFAAAPPHRQQCPPLARSPLVFRGLLL